MMPTMNFYANPPARSGLKGSLIQGPPAIASTASAERPKQVNLSEKDDKEVPYKMQIKWRNVAIFAYLHLAAMYGFTLPKLRATIISGWIIGILAGIGTTVGSHRLFTHRTFTANTKLRVLLMLLQTMSGQEPVLKWARDHRVHHKFTDTNADPYNSRRGFFFAHIGWLMCKKHPDVLSQGKKVDMRDLETDPVLLWQQKVYWPLAFFLCMLGPVLLNMSWGESFSSAWNGHLFRYIIGLHLVWMVNSVAHLWGSKPFDKSISPTDTYFVGFCALGEGWHNYHHCFPWDYKTAELPTYGFNVSTAFIDFFAWLGWATELKTVPDNVIKNRILRTGDGTHEYSKKNLEKIEDSNNNNTEADEQSTRDIEHFWGFGDDEMTKMDMKRVKIIH